MGGCDGFIGSRRVGAVCNPVLVAVSALSCDRLDVSRRLFARGVFDAAGSGSRWDADVSPDYVNDDRTDWNWPLAVAPRFGRCALFLRRAGDQHGVAASLFVGRKLKI